MRFTVATNETDAAPKLEVILAADRHLPRLLEGDPLARSGEGELALARRHWRWTFREATATVAMTFEHRGQ